MNTNYDWGKLIELYANPPVGMTRSQIIKMVFIEGEKLQNKLEKIRGFILISDDIKYSSSYESIMKVLDS